MAELSDEDLTRFENEFNELRSEVFVFRAILGAIMANAVASREKSVELFDELRVQTHTGLTRLFACGRTPETLKVGSSHECMHGLG